MWLAFADFGPMLSASTHAFAIFDKLFHIKYFSSPQISKRGTSGKRLLDTFKWKESNEHQKLELNHCWHLRALCSDSFWATGLKEESTPHFVSLSRSYVSFWQSFAPYSYTRSLTLLCTWQLLVVTLLLKDILKKSELFHAKHT